jgi:hypothetical protein
MRRIKLGGDIGAVGHAVFDLQFRLRVVEATPEWPFQGMPHQRALPLQ